jgi:murein L,D-transpeptidase YcbB/YkuD
VTRPLPAATYERARRLANIAVWTIVLQHRRLRTREPEDGEFLFRRWADFQFLIVALTRLRRAGVLATKVPVIEKDIRAALHEFDVALPDLKKMRDIAEHFDDYAVDEGRNRQVSRKSLEVGVIGETTFQWLGSELNADVALNASRRLFNAIQVAQSAFIKGKQPG